MAGDPSSLADCEPKSLTLRPAMFDVAVSTGKQMARIGACTVLAPCRQLCVIAGSLVAELTNSSGRGLNPVASLAVQ